MAKSKFRFRTTKTVHHDPGLQVLNDKGEILGRVTQWLVSGYKFRPWLAELPNGVKLMSAQDGRSIKFKNKYEAAEALSTIHNALS